MDLTSLYYFQELSKDLNMTKAAERLYISQQTLSNHIQRLEQYYGTKLFYRKPSLSPSRKPDMHEPSRSLRYDRQPFISPMASFIRAPAEVTGKSGDSRRDSISSTFFTDFS